MRSNGAKTLSSLRIGDDVLKGVGAITVLAAIIEFWTELAVRVAERKTLGERPVPRKAGKNRQPISSLVTRLVKVATVVNDKELAAVLSQWCTVTSQAFNCRNDLTHGLPFHRSPTVVSFGRDFRWEGMAGQRPNTEFQADVRTLTLLSDAFAAIYGVIVRFAKFWSNLSPSMLEVMKRELQGAESILCELTNFTATVGAKK